MQATLKNEEICCTGKVSSIGEIMIQTFLGKRSIKNLELRHGKEKQKRKQKKEKSQPELDATTKTAMFTENSRREEEFLKEP